MANRRLTETELRKVFRPILDDVRACLVSASGGDEELRWALRRKLAKELFYDERGKPLHRRRLKALKMCEQLGKCSICGCALPARGSVLDRIEGMKGYTPENTRLLCRECDQSVQAERFFS